MQNYRGNRIIAIVLSIIIGCSVLYNFTDHKSSSATQNEDDISNNQVYVMAQSIVTERLKSPASADYPLYPEQISKRDDGVYVIMSYVDAQNAFGANLRKHWVCQLKYKGGDSFDINNWQIIETTFL